MSAKDIDDYLKKVAEPQRSTLQEVRKAILSILPDCEECISYGMPAFKVRGKVMAGFAAAKHFNSYYPHSGSILNQFEHELASYSGTMSALHFAKDKPLPKALLKKLINAKYHLVFGEAPLKTKPDPDE